MPPSIRAALAEYPSASYVGLTFAISWGGVVIAVGPGRIPGTPEQLAALLPIAVVAMLAGPAVAGVALTALADGAAGLRAYRSRLLAWRVHWSWYAVALGLAPLLLGAVLLALSVGSPVFTPGILVSADRRTLVLAGIAIAAGAGLFEELGWTGFATPRLRRRYGVIATGLVIGLWWSAWHLLVAVWASGTVSGPLERFSYLVDPFLLLAPFRVLMVWVYDRTGSLLIAILMHLSLTASVRIIGAPGLAGSPLLIFDVVWLGAVSAIVAALILRPQRTANHPL